MELLLLALTVLSELDVQVIQVSGTLNYYVICVSFFLMVCVKGGRHFFQVEEQWLKDCYFFIRERGSISFECFCRSAGEDCGYE